HFGWALWCGTVWWSFSRHPVARSLSVIYPMMTLLAIIVTANHYWLDAAGGAVIFLAASQILRMLRIRSSRKVQALVE
ncbi:MAG TPA: phosphatase PAP2 family protein, partial [Ilumatobacteraceae bacterium]|nr:phosphatase PAP2 family protein [Ilumatobacteraceae bacterium]